LPDIAGKGERLYSALLTRFSGLEAGSGAFKPDFGHRLTAFAILTTFDELAKRHFLKQRRNDAMSLILLFQHVTLAPLRYDFLVIASPSHLVGEAGRNWVEIVWCSIKTGMVVVFCFKLKPSDFS
jgi:hypothetical protein